MCRNYSLQVSISPRHFAPCILYRTSGVLEWSALVESYQYPEQFPASVLAPFAAVLIQHRLSAPAEVQRGLGIKRFNIDHGHADLEVGFGHHRLRLPSVRPLGR